ncbi:hypothetical protein BD289DRAFT_427344 [Coniella lustricola]|uniref:Secreted protein n=1 Tax=Coniella lustricola TaxID=2025994 RepID=A0A2T3AFG9_9PEZI|nr:hypothetical protein BD289DRAFT_427344 [Coniella lustricola]
MNARHAGKQALSLFLVFTSLRPQFIGRQSKRPNSRQSVRLTTYTNTPFIENEEQDTAARPLVPPLGLFVIIFQIASVDSMETNGWRNDRRTGVGLRSLE